MRYSVTSKSIALPIASAGGIADARRENLLAFNVLSKRKGAGAAWMVSRFLNVAGGPGRRCASCLNFKLDVSVLEKRTVKK